MLPREENDLLTHTGTGKPLGLFMRRYWIPALLSEEIPEPDGPPVRVRLLGEDRVSR
jgi:phthalate 4,5-dioxygenase oxygenase subunit